MQNIRHFLSQAFWCIVGAVHALYTWFPATRPLSEPQDVDNQTLGPRVSFKASSDKMHAIGPDSSVSCSCPLSWGCWGCQKPTKTQSEQVTCLKRGFTRTARKHKCCVSRRFYSRRAYPWIKHMGVDPSLQPSFMIPKNNTKNQTKIQKGRLVLPYEGEQD